MAETELRTRISLRGDTAANWEKADPVLKLNEMIIVIDETGAGQHKFKVGDGVKKYSELLFTIDIASVIAKIPHACEVFKLTKADLEASDDSVLATVTNPQNSDVAVITTQVDGQTYEISSYIYDGKTKAWIAATGPVDADKVIFREDTTLAGSYTQIGNWTKSASGTATKSTKGKSWADVWKEITTATVQPTITAQPAVSGFALTGAGAKEAGTKLASAAFGTAVLSAGSYSAFPNQVATGIKAKSYSVARVTNVAAMNTVVATAASGTDNNGTNGFIIGDKGGDNVVSSLAYKVTVAYDKGNQAKDNLGNPSNPAVAIPAGSKEQTTSAYTCYRNIFYGGVSDATPLQGAAITSAKVRSLTKSNNAYSARTLTVNVPAGATAVYIACINGKTGVTKVINETALNADVTSTFTKQANVMVEGAEGYAAVAYNVWYFVPAVPYANAAVLKVTLG